MFGKYEFENEAEAKVNIRAIEGTPGVVDLGFIIIRPATYFKNGKVKKDEIRNAKYSVDVLWETAEPDGWKMYRITLGNNPSSHEFAGTKYYESL